MRSKLTRTIGNVRYGCTIFLFILLPVSGYSNADQPCVVAPQFDAASIDDEQLTLTELNGAGAVYLKFWLSTCPNCIAEMPHFAHNHEQYGDEIKFVAVNLATDGETQQIVRDAAEKYGLAMAHVFDEGGDLRRSFDVFATPTHVIIDRKGRIVHRSNVADEDLDKVLDDLYRGNQTGRD